jgi:hypothetical protein
MAESDLLEETQKDGKPDHLKAPIIRMRSQGMNRPTLGTAIAPQTQRFGTLVEISPYIPVTPQPVTPTSRTTRRTRPWIFLSDLLQDLDIEIAIQYQLRSLWGITEDTLLLPENAPSVIPSLSLQLILRRKKTYTINGEILGRGLGRTM